MSEKIKGFYLVLNAGEISAGQRVLGIAGSLQGARRLSSRLEAARGWPCLIARVLERKTLAEALAERDEDKARAEARRASQERLERLLSPRRRSIDEP